MAVAAVAWVLAYVAAVVVVVIVGLFALRTVGSGPPPAAPLALVVILGTAGAALAAVRIHLLGRHGLRWADLGLRRPDRSPLHLLWQIPAVMLAGATASALVLVPLGLGEDAGATDEDALADLVTGGPVVVVLGLLAVAAIVPLMEEVVFRGIVLPAFRARYRAALGITLAGLVFAVVHLIPPAMPYLVVVGISLCAMAEWYRSIVPGIVLHGVNNAVVFASIMAATAVL